MVWIMACRKRKRKGLRVSLVRAIYLAGLRSRDLGSCPVAVRTVTIGWLIDGIGDDVDAKVKIAIKFWWGKDKDKMIR